MCLSLYRGIEVILLVQDIIYTQLKCKLDSIQINRALSYFVDYAAVSLFYSSTHRVNTYLHYKLISSMSFIYVHIY